MPDHPRACGEDERRKVLRSRDSGPPPRMRGRRQRVRATLTLKETTPAHAGKTVGDCPGGNEPGDHPRACGEDKTVSWGKAQDLGPPPRMRGRPLPGHGEREQNRTTPAHAGKTSPQAPEARYMTDHPRACGEDHFPCRSLISVCGPPPRMRGRPRHLRAAILVDGTTPAHAGKTRCGRL